jgi:hypothetical protein
MTSSEFEMKEANEPSSIEVGPPGAGQILTNDDQMLARLGKKPVLKVRCPELTKILRKPLQLLMVCLQLETFELIDYHLIVGADIGKHVAELWVYVHAWLQLYCHDNMGRGIVRF